MLLINILNQNRLQVSQLKKKKKKQNKTFTSSLLKLFLETIVKRAEIVQ